MEENRFHISVTSIPGPEPAPGPASKLFTFPDRIREAPENLEEGELRLHELERYVQHE